MMIDVQNLSTNYRAVKPYWKRVTHVWRWVPYSSEECSKFNTILWALRIWIGRNESTASERNA
jgi:hypothetical protein